MLKWIVLFISFHALANDHLVKLRVKRHFVQRAQLMVEKMGVDVPRDLRKHIGFNFIEVTKDNLIDNRGSIVDAIGVPGKVTLSETTWPELIESGVNLDLLILHELYRMAGINDDSYKKSLPAYLEYFPVTQGQRIYCDLNEANIEIYFEKKKMSVTGQAAIQSGGVIRFSLQNGPSQKASENALALADSECLKKGYSDGFAVVSWGSTIIGEENHNGFKWRGAKVPLKVHCLRKKSRKLNQLERNRIMCEKINRCSEILDKINNPVQKNELLELRDERGC